MSSSLLWVQNPMLLICGFQGCLLLHIFYFETIDVYQEPEEAVEDEKNEDEDGESKEDEDEEQDDEESENEDKKDDIVQVQSLSFLGKTLINYCCGVQC